MRISELHYQVRANSLVLYYQPLDTHHRRFNLLEAEMGTYSGKVTNHARKRLLSALDLLVQKSPKRKIYNPISGSTHDFKLAFITLTIAERRNLELREAYDKLLRPFLRYMKKKQGMTEYVWKGEYQERGQVHYHVATNTFIPWNVIRWKWNDVQRRSRLLDDFARRYKHYDPNGTDIHAMQNVEDSLAYIAKEMCKNVQNTRVTKGKIWDCNVELKKKRFSSVASDHTISLIDDALQFGFATKIEAERCWIIKTKDPLAYLPGNDLKAYRNYIS